MSDLRSRALAATVRNGASRSTCGREFVRSTLLAWLRSTLLDHGLHTTLKASQSVAGGRSEASTPGSKNAPTQSILKGCQITSIPNRVQNTRSSRRLEDVESMRDLCRDLR